MTKISVNIDKKTIDELYALHGMSSVTSTVEMLSSIIKDDIISYIGCNEKIVGYYDKVRKDIEIAVDERKKTESR